MPDPAPILSPERNPEAAPVSSSIEAPFLSSSSNVLSPTLRRNSSELQRRSKRRREEEDPESDEQSTQDFEFYGYPADSFIFSSLETQEDLQHEEEQDPLPVVPIRRSKRRNKKRRKSDFVYHS